MQLEPANPHRFCVAPMLDWTTPECRALHRLFSRHAFLYSEMVTSGALIFGDVPRHLHHAADAPCALQLGLVGNNVVLGLLKRGGPLN